MVKAFGIHIAFDSSTMATQSTCILSTFRLPNLEATFSALPDHGLNPYHEEIRAESRAWINNYSKTFCGPKMCAFMNNCNFELINTFCYPYAGKAGLRATMDLVSYSSVPISYRKTYL